MALHVCKNINVEFYVIVNNLFSTKYLINIFDGTRWLKGMISIPRFKDLVSFSNVT